MYVVNMLLFPDENYRKQIYFDKKWYRKCKYCMLLFMFLAIIKILFYKLK